jgi:predicted metal-binding membrane protein
MGERIAIPRRGDVAAWIAFLAIAALAWGIVIARSDGMAMPAMMPLPAFLAFWAGMMIAMMFPSVAPTAILWASAISRTTSGFHRFLRISAFVAGYLIAWSAFGAGAYVALLQLSALVEHSPQTAPLAGAAIFLFAAVYQLTPLKRACLLHCRSPIAALLHYAQFAARGRDLLVGLHHGAYCVGCCWGLMALLLAAGVMNVPAMAAVAALIYLEKRWRKGERLAAWTAAAFACLAVLALLQPSLFPGLH